MSLRSIEEFMDDCCRFSFVLITKYKLSQDITQDTKEIFERVQTAEKMMEEFNLELFKKSIKVPAERAKIDQRYESVKKKYDLFQTVIPSMRLELPAPEEDPIIVD